ncbi:hypothetical protein CCACVL1_10905, partial [Corchorus capsularis]
GVESDDWEPNQAVDDLNGGRIFKA